MLTEEQKQKNDSKLRIMSALLGAAFVIFIIAVGFIVSWTFTGKDVIVLKQGEPVAIIPKQAKPGQTVTMKISFCKVVPATGRVTRRLVSTTSEVFAPTDDDSTGKRCYNKVAIPVPVPEQTTCGIYHVNYRVIYRTNPLRTVTEEINSEEFRVC